MTDSIRIPLFHQIANVALRAAYWVALDLDIQGIEGAPRTGPLIIAINHNSFIDPLIPIVYLRSDVLPMAKVELFKSIFGPVFWWYGAFPVRRGEGDLNALKQSLRILRAGHAMLISPEGTRTKSGVLKEPFEGPAVIAVRSGAPILPVALWGGKQFWSNLKRLRRTPLHTRIGAPLVLRNVASKPSREILRAISDELMYYIAQMLPPELRGRYADVDRFAPRFLFPHAAVEVESQPSQKKEVMPMTS